MSTDPLEWGSTAAASQSSTPIGELPGVPVGNTPASVAIPFDLPEPERYRDPMLLGAGAMGRVDAVFDVRLGRVVAMKTIRAEVATPAMLHRFVREGRLTASLDHPDIVSVYDAGRCGDGRVFYTMRLVQGRPLAEVFAATAASQRLTQLLRPFHRACEAVAYAHERNVVHRDLKPSNIMLSDFGQVQVVDWGLARHVRSNDTDDALDDALGASPSPLPATGTSTPRLTRAGAVIGTPAYMSPEQARGESATPATDVWALGAILYELLAHHRYTERPAAVSVDEALAAAPPELTAIARRALAAKNDERYRSAKTLAQDLGAYLDGHRVSAHSYSTWQLLRRVAKRWRAPLAVAAAALVVLAVVGVTSYQATVAERDRAKDAEAAALDASTRANRTLAASLAEQAVDKLGQHGLGPARILSLEALARDPGQVLARGVLAALPTAPTLALETSVQLPDDCLKPTTSPSGELVACIHRESVEVWQISPLKPVATFIHANVTKVLFAEGVGAVLLSSNSGFTGSYAYPLVYPFRITTGDPLGPVIRGSSTFAASDRAIMLSADFVAYTSLDVPISNAANVLPLDPAGQLRIITQAPSTTCPMSARAIVGLHRGSEQLSVLCGMWQLQRFKGQTELLPATTLPLAHMPTALGWAGADRHLVGDVKGGLTLVDPTTGAVVGPRTTLAPGMVDSIDITDDGRWALVHTDRAGGFVWDVVNHAIVQRLPRVYGDRASLSRDGRWLTVVDDNKRLRRFRHVPQAPWRLTFATGLTDAQLTARGEVVVANALGVGIASATDIGRPRRRIDMPERAKAMDTSPDGQDIYAATWHRSLMVGAVSPPSIREWDDAGSELSLRRVAALADGWVLGCCGAPGLHGFPPSGAAANPLIMPAKMIDLDRRHDRRGAVALDAEGALWRVRLDATVGPPVVDALGTVPTARSVATTQGEDLVLVDDAGAALRSGTDLRVLQRYAIGARRPLDVVVSPDDKLVTFAERDGDASVWDLETGSLVADLRGHSERSPSVSFGPDGKHLITASWDGTARLWNVATFTQGSAALAQRLEQARTALDLSLKGVLQD